MTESLNHHQQAELLGIARNIAWALNSASPTRRKTLKNIWLKKVARSNGFDAQFIESFSAAIKSDNLESALQYVFSIIPFSSTGTRYIFHDAAFELRVVKTRENPPVPKKKAKDTTEVESAKAKDTTEVESAKAKDTTEVESEKAKDTPPSEDKSDVSVEQQEPDASTKISVDKVDSSETEPVAPPEIEVKKEVKQLTQNEKDILKLEREIKALTTRQKRRKKHEEKHRNSSSNHRYHFWDKECGGGLLSELVDLEEAEEEALKLNGIESIGDLLFTAPVDFQKIVPAQLNNDELGTVRTYRGKIIGKWVRIASQITRYEILLSVTDELVIRCQWVKEPPRGWADWRVGFSIALIGEVEFEDNYQLFNSEPVGVDGRGSGWLPDYNLKDIDNRSMRNWVSLSLGRVVYKVQDPLPKDILQGSRLLFFDEALRDAHFPSNSNFRGHERLAFDEAFFYLIYQQVRSGSLSGKGFSHKILHRGVGKIGEENRVTLNDEQEIAFGKIRREMATPKPMRRILQGDIGAGKWSISLLTAILAAETGNQVLYICTDPITAERRHWMANPLLKSLGLSSQLLTGTPNGAQLDAIKNGLSNMCFGTKEHLSKSIPWKSLSLIIVEESTEFGSLLPKEQMNLPRTPDILLVTPTPLSINILDAVYPSFSLSRIKTNNLELIPATVYKDEDREQAYAELKSQVESGRQGYIVFPVKEGRDLLSLNDAKQFAAAIQTELLAGVKIGVFSSGMDRDSRRVVMEEFQQRRIDVLLCTTYIEDAQPVPNATAMVVEYAELSSFSRLHRLRGLVSGSLYKSNVGWLLSTNVTPESEGMLKQLKGMVDGYRIGELEEQVYGFQELVGVELDSPKGTWTQKNMSLMEIRILARKVVSDISVKEVLENRWPSCLTMLSKLHPDIVIPPPSNRPKRRRKKGRNNRNKRS